MNYQRKIISYFFLAAYTIVVLHQGIHHGHFLESNEGDPSHPSHDHGHFEDLQFKNRNHYSIFHFLVHLFENIHHEDELKDENYLENSKKYKKKEIDSKTNIIVHLGTIKWWTIESDVKSRFSHPYLIPIKQQVFYSNTPSRSPPAFA